MAAATKCLFRRIKYNTAQNCRSAHSSVEVKRFVSEEDVRKFAILSGDTNPIHVESGTRNIVHGAFLLGIVSGVIGTRLPGPGTILISLNARFLKPCPVNTNVNVKIELTDKRRKITSCKFGCTNMDKDEELLSGEAKLILPQ